MNPLAALRHYLRRRRLVALAASHGTAALRAYHRGDRATFAAQINTLARHSNAAVYLAVVGWMINIRRAVALQPGNDWEPEVGAGDEVGVHRLDDPDSEQRPRARAAVWATRILTCVLNGDQETAAALFVARAAEGNPHLTYAIDAAADMTITLIADTPHGRAILRH